MYDVYFRKAALDAAILHASRGAADQKETMGLLVGSFNTYNSRPWVFAEDYVTVQNDATSVNVRFARDSFPELSSKLFSAADSRKVVVGWLHSHPSYDCFLSHTDIGTQQRFFDHPQSIAAVVDPLRPEAGSVKKRVFRLNGPQAAAYHELSFAVV